MLYYKDDAHLQEYKFCDSPYYKVYKPQKRRKQEDVPFTRKRYLCTIYGLKRLFSSHSFACHLTWCYENPRDPGLFCQPSDGEAWKYFDET